MISGFEISMSSWSRKAIYIAKVTHRSWAIAGSFPIFSNVIDDGPRRLASENKKEKTTPPEWLRTERRMIMTYLFRVICGFSKKVQLAYLGVTAPLSKKWSIITLEKTWKFTLKAFIYMVLNAVLCWVQWYQYIIPGCRTTGSTGVQSW